MAKVNSKMFNNIFKKISKNTDDLGEGVFKQFLDSVDDMGKYGSKNKDDFNFSKSGGKKQILSDYNNWQTGSGRRSVESSYKDNVKPLLSRPDRKLNSKNPFNDSNLEERIMNQRSSFDSANQTKILAEKEKISAAQKLRSEAADNSKAYRDIREQKIREGRNKDPKIYETNTPMREKKMNKAEDSIFATMSDEKFEKIEAARVKEKGFILEDKKIEKMKVAAEKSPSGGNASANNTDPKGNGNNTVYNMAAMGVGGGLVFSLANNKGQQSNSQLYGQ